MRLRPHWQHLGSLPGVWDAVPTGVTMAIARLCRLCTAARLEAAGQRGVVRTRAGGAAPLPAPGPALRPPGVDQAHGRQAGPGEHAAAGGTAEENQEAGMKWLPTLFLLPFFCSALTWGPEGDRVPLNADWLAPRSDRRHDGSLHPPGKCSGGGADVSGGGCGGRRLLTTSARRFAFLHGGRHGRDQRWY